MRLQRIDRSICQCGEMGQVHGKPYSSGYRRGASQSNHYIGIFHPPDKWHISVGAEDLPFPEEHGGIRSFGGSIRGDNRFVSMIMVKMSCSWYSGMDECSTHLGWDSEPWEWLRLIHVYIMLV